MGSFGKMARWLVGIFVLTSLLAACGTETTGDLQVAVTGLPDGVDADIHVTGPAGTDQRVTGSTVLRQLEPGDYRVRSSTVGDADGVYDPTPEDDIFEVTAGNTTRVDVTYAASESFAELQEGSHVIDEESRDALAEYAPDGTLRFSTSTEQLAEIEVGDVLVSDVVDGVAPDGFLRTVASVRDEAGAIVLETEPATLTELVQRARASAVVDLSQAEVRDVRLLQPGVSFRAPGRDGVSTAQTEYDFVFDFDETLVDTDTFTLTVDGALEFDADLLFDLEIDGTLVPPEVWVELFEIGVEFDERASLTVTAEAELDFEEEIPIATISIAEIVIPAGPVPIVFTVDLTVLLGTDGSLRAVATSGAVQTASLTIGARYRHEQGWEDLWETDSSFDVQPPTIEGDANMRAYAAARLAAGLYGEAGAAGTLTTRAFLEVDAALPRYPLWCLYAGVDASYGYNVTVPVLDIDLIDRDVVFAEIREELSCAPNNPPNVTISSPLDGATFEEASTWSRSADASDIEMSGDPVVRWELDGGPVPNPQTICPGDYTLTAIARDAAGGESTDSITITIVNGTPDVKIDEVEPASPGEDNDVRLTGHAVDPTCTDSRGTAAIDLDELTWSLQDGFGGTGPGILSAFTSQGTKDVILTYTDAGGATGSATREVTVEAHNPSAQPMVVIERPQSNQRFPVSQASSGNYTVELVGDASDAVLDADLAWSYRAAGDDTWTDAGNGREALLQLPVPAGQDQDYEVWFREGDASFGDLSSDAVEIEVEGVIQ